MMFRSALLPILPHRLGDVALRAGPVEAIAFGACGFAIGLGFLLEGWVIVNDEPFGQNYWVVAASHLVWWLVPLFGFWVLIGAILLGTPEKLGGVSGPVLRAVVLSPLTMAVPCVIAGVTLIWSVGRAPFGDMHMNAVVPCSSVLAAPLIGGLSLWFAIARQHPADRFCKWCGYPRTGLPAGALCPECGKSMV